MKTTDSPWTEAEDSSLSAARAMGLKWEAIASYLPGRTGAAASARHRYLIAQATGIKRHRPYVPEKRPTRADPGLVTPPAPSAPAIDKLRAATDRLYEREARRRRVSLATVIISMQQGPQAAALWQAQVA